MENDSAAATPQYEPLIVRCRFCDQYLTLNPDSAEAREAGTDPYQQLRRHITEHFNSSIQLAQRCVWLIDSLAFTSIQDPERWRAHLHRLLDSIIDKEAPEVAATVRGSGNL